MNKIENIMTAEPFWLTQHANINKARRLMAEKKIRHLPIKNLESGKLAGMLSQKSVLINAIRIINSRGLDQLEHCEKSMDVGSIMSTEPAVFDINDKLLDVANNLTEQRSGCVAIEKEGKLVGVITSNDFVKFAVAALAND
jgi:CBS domain-containing membrane protein